MEEIELEIEPREALADPWRALADDAPRLHEHPTNAVFDHFVEGETSSRPSRRPRSSSSASS